MSLRQLPSDVLASAFKLSITRSELETLYHLNWLCGNVINFYMQMIVQRSRTEAEQHSKQSSLRVGTVNTFFYTKLVSSGYNSVRRWTRLT